MRATCDHPSCFDVPFACGLFSLTPQPPPISYGYTLLALVRSLSGSQQHGMV